MFFVGVMAQVDKVLAAADRERLQKMLDKQLKMVQDDIGTTRQELLHIDKVTKMLSPQITSNKEASKKMDSVKRQKENKVQSFV